MRVADKPHVRICPSLKKRIALKAIELGITQTEMLERAATAGLELLDKNEIPTSDR